ncbi:MAG: V/A-type H+-transporting ATPase subunit A [Kiritimatiellia bacterium]|jgi:V/A-type H+/Na+-transporting ATPase subunit A
MTAPLGKVCAVNGNLVCAHFSDAVVQNELAYVRQGAVRLKAEVIRIRDQEAELQVFEDTSGLRIGDDVEFTGELLSVELGPGLLGQIYDGLQNPLPQLADAHGFFLPRGVYLDPLDHHRAWEFTPSVKPGDVRVAGETLGTVPENSFTHRIMVPFDLPGTLRVIELAPKGSYTIDDVIARVSDEHRQEHEVRMLQRWPIKIPITAYAHRRRPKDPLVTQVRIIDTFFPVALGGTYCIPGPFGAGKTVLQQITSRHAEIDILILAACGERAGEVVETLKEFPALTDPRTGCSLMERTLIICNTSSMPVAAREASVYTAITLAEYYRQMGLNVLLLADSTSRWAQALREMSGRLEEIPGEEAFPAYLESVIAAFYERGGLVRLRDGSYGSVTIGGTVSPAGGNFEEPVTQSTLKVVGAFHGLSRERSDARRYPAIHPLESWSKYSSIVPDVDLAFARTILEQGDEVAQMMKVVGEEGTGIDDFITYLKAEYLDAVYLQQDAYDPVDGASSADRQRYVFTHLTRLLRRRLRFDARDDARSFFQRLTQLTLDWNRVAMEDPAFKEIESRLDQLLAGVHTHAENT